MNNIITIEFLDKKGFPPGVWLNEPDLCFWYHGLPCLALRDMNMGVWKGFVGVPSEHPLFEKPINYIATLPYALDLFQSVHGGLSKACKLPIKFVKNCWWIGIEASHGGDMMPLVRLDPEIAKVSSEQTYKDIHFIRRETNKLARRLIKIK